jgi:cytoskeletal protein RodZ
MDLPFQKKTIIDSAPLGEQLKKEREKKNISLSVAEHETKIRSRYLEAMENGRFDLVPLSHSKGFVRRYAAYLGVEPAVINQSIDRLVTSLPRKQPFSPRALGKETRIFITPRLVASVFSVIVLIVFIGYITYQVKQFAAPPPLEITKPIDESIVATETVAIEGHTEPGSAVYIDNGSASTSSDGTFSYMITLRPGLNQITVRAENRIKKSSTKVLSVLYQAPPPTPTPIPSPTPEVTPSPSPSLSPITPKAATPKPVGTVTASPKTLPKESQ